MTPRIVLIDLATEGRRHRESPIAGYPDCGTPLHTPHRAIAIDDERLCGHCWGDVVSEVAS